MFSTFLKPQKDLEGLTRCVSIFIVGHLLIGLGVFSGVCSENLSKLVVIVPVTTFYGLMAPFASLVIVAYLTDNMCHLLAMIALERKQLENIPKPLRKLKLRFTGPETGSKLVIIKKSFSLLGI